MNTTYREILGIRTRTLESDGDGSPVLLIHGLGGSVDSWAKNIDALSAHHKIVALDLPGFGLSDKPRITYSTKFYADFISHFITELNFPVSIVGSSLGGQIAAEIAIKNQELVSNLVLISPAGVPPFSFKGSQALRSYIRVTNAKNSREIKQILQSIDGVPVSDEYAQWVFDRISMPGAKEAFHSALKESAKAPRLTKRLHKMASPTLVLWGQKDTMIPVKYASSLIGIENIRVVLLENCGHRPHAENPQVFNNLISEYLKTDF